ncbi:MAG: helix-turn-helix domain-containing protein [Clostridium sp.]|nr:helix-turn-helix domain-containing protein [Clostridium sp.]
MSKTMDICVFNECCGGKHTHEYPQIFVPLRDNLRIWIGEVEYNITPKELCFVPAGMVHDCCYVGQLLVIDMAEEFLEQQDAVLLSYPVIVQMQNQITQLVDLIQEELRQNPKSTAVYHLYNYLYNKVLENCVTASMRYMSEHYDEPITVNELAEIEKYNVTYYNDWFKQKTGFSPNLYLRCIRINKAKELLEETDHSIMDIALMVGYSSNSTLTRAFHSVTGMTPKEYRTQATMKKIG